MRAGIGKEHFADDLVPDSNNKSNVCEICLGTMRTLLAYKIETVTTCPVGGDFMPVVSQITQC